eukprot:6180304-Prymnesium_polylepis.1
MSGRTLGSAFGPKLAHHAQEAATSSPCARTLILTSLSLIRDQRVYVTKQLLSAHPVGMQTLGAGAGALPAPFPPYSFPPPPARLPT